MVDRWFEEGLRFTCRRCGACCTGEPGYVFLDKGESGVIAAFLGLDEVDFRRKFTCRAGDHTSLVEEADGRCVFYAPEGCRIYLVRPLQCSTFPFWLRNIARRENWEKAGRECPGIESGRLHRPEEIEKIISGCMG